MFLSLCTSELSIVWKQGWMEKLFFRMTEHGIHITLCKSSTLCTVKVITQLWFVIRVVSNTAYRAEMKTAES
jgi:hypothetical protein